MKKLTYLLLLITLLFTSGCFQVSMMINLKKDGSGTIVEKLQVTPAMISMMEMQNSMKSKKDQGESSEETSNTLDQDSINTAFTAKAKIFGEGVTFKNHRLLGDNKHEYEVTYAFEDISKVKINTAMKKLLPSDLGKKKKKVETKEEVKDEIFDFDFKKKWRRSVLTINSPYNFEKAKKESESEDGKKKKESKAIDEDTKKMMPMMKSMFAGAYVKCELNIDGKIKRSNASFQDDNTITLFYMDLSKLMTMMDTLENMDALINDMKSEKEYRKLIESLDGVKMEINKETTVKFK